MAEHTQEQPQKLNTNIFKSIFTPKSSTGETTTRTSINQTSSHEKGIIITIILAILCILFLILFYVYMNKHKNDK